MSGIAIAAAGAMAAGQSSGGGGGGPAPIVTVTPSTLSVHKPGGGLCSFTFSSTITGGTPPYARLWSEGSGDRTLPSTTFSKNAPGQDEIDGVVSLRVTDSAVPPQVVIATGEWFAYGF